jgi:hypothetical protein
MKSYVYLFGMLLVGFVVYFLVKDNIFGSDSVLTRGGNAVANAEAFEVPAPSSIEIRQAPIYPRRVVAPSGPNPPSQEAPEGQVVMHAAPQPDDPYYESQESSDIPENLRYPERSFRPPPVNDNTSIAVEAGIASNNMQVTSDNSQRFQPDFIQGGGEFMPGIYANDTMDDKSFSTF